MTDVVLLEALPETAFATEALKRLQQARQSAIVVHGREPHVLEVKDLIGALRDAVGDADVRLADIPPQLVRLAPERRESLVLPLTFGFVDEMERGVAHRRFEETGAQVIVTAVRDGRGRVITHSEVLAQGMSGPVTLCTCRKTSTHVWYDWEVTNPPRCNRGDDVVDCAP